jgi:3-deoxy-D-manno-octulosonate 8-phosphate phosphatase KdsC-like HAD superfamily phosphatase
VGGIILSGNKTPNSIEQIIGRIRLVAFDFDGVFTNNMVYVFEDGTEAVRCTRSDGTS